MTRPLPPGEILLFEFMRPRNMSSVALAASLGIPAREAGEIITGKKPITPELAAKLATTFGPSVRFWLDLQAGHDSGATR